MVRNKEAGSFGKAVGGIKIIESDIKVGNVVWVVINVDFGRNIEAKED